MQQPVSVSFESMAPRHLDGATEVYVEVFNAAPWNDGWNRVAARARLERLISNPEHVGVAVTEGGEVLGFACGWLDPWIRGAQFHLKELCITPRRRREGLGRHLVAELMARLRSQGVDGVYLMTQPRSPAAAFYEALGFRVQADQCMAVELAVHDHAAGQALQLASGRGDGASS